MQRIDAIIKANRNDQAVAIPSICSAHPQILTAGILLAKRCVMALLVEITSNQMNQRGGYTGSKPAEFTMGKAIDLVQAYVKAGFRKIYFNFSEGCLGEPAQVGDNLAASRAAILAKACEEVADDPSQLRYIAGTEVPPPDGARTDEADMKIIATEPAHAQTTIIKHQQAFAELGFTQIWDKVIGLVVQPGLEFALNHVFPFDSSAPDLLSVVLNEYPNLWYEAHSTDYRNTDVYPEIASRHFGYADKIRYYWAIPQAQKSVFELMKNLDIQQQLRPLLEQYFAEPTLSLTAELKHGEMKWAAA